MRHLTCSRCAKRLIDDFWAMVEAEPVPTFSRITLTCECGEVVSVNTEHGLKWLPQSSLPSRLELRR